MTSHKLVLADGADDALGQPIGVGGQTQSEGLHSMHS